MAFRRRPRLPDDISPEEREQRIAELRERRRRRLRVLAIRSALVSLGVLLLAAAALYWLLATFGGRDFLLTRIAAALPAGTELHWGSAEGPASGPLELRDVRYVQRGCPDVDGEPVPYGQCAQPTVLTFTAARVLLNPEITPLIGRRLRLDALEVDGAVLDLPAPADTPFELPTWPEVLPRIELPLSLQADAIRVDGLRVTRAGAPLVDIATIRAGLDARQGQLDVNDLVVESDRGRFTAHGTYAPADNYRTDLTVTALLPAPFPQPRPRLGLVARGDLDLMDVAVSGHAPGPLRAVLALRGRDWSLRADADALDPALLAGSGEAGTPLAFSLEADGQGGRADMRGRLRRDTLQAVLQPSRVRLEEQVLELQPLVLDVFDGRITARGRGDFSTPRAADFRFAVNARGLRFGGDPAAHDPEPADPAPVVGVDADLGIAGTSRAWAVIGKGTLERDGLRGQVELDGRGDHDRLRLRTLRATTPGGRLEGSGEVGWTPGLRWDLEAMLQGFDPGYVVPGWQGAIEGRLASQGGLRDDGGLDLRIEARDLGGTLRGRRLGGQARFAMRGGASAADRSDYEGEASLQVGESRIQATGTLADRLALDAQLTPLNLGDLLPGATGTLRGTLQAQGARNAPDLAADLQGAGLRWNSYAASTLHLHGSLPWSRGNGQLVVEASGLEAGVALDQARVEANGRVDDMRLEASARSAALGSLDLRGSARQRGRAWSGELAALQLQPNRGAAWTLQAPARWSWEDAAWTLSRACLDAAGGGALCAQAQWPRTGVTLAGDQLPLALFGPWLPAREDGRPWALRGQIDLDGQLRPSGRAYAGQFTLRSAEGGLRNSERARNDLLGYSDLRLDARLDAARIEATLSTVLNGSGHVRAQLATGWEPASPLSGQVSMDTDELVWLELLSPDIVEPTGRLRAEVQLGGRRAQPLLGGQARLSDFSTELPALGIVLESGDLVLQAQDDGSARITGSVMSGGRLDVSGSLNWRDTRAPLLLRLTGQNVLASDTRDLRVVADPDLELRYRAGEPLSLSGSVTVPSAMIDLERLDRGVSVSPDVVVLDPVDPDAGHASPLLLDLTLAMGDDVRLRGFGLDGTLAGSMRVRASPGREMTGSGTLDVGGRYIAYGQELDITRGRLTFSGPISDPLLDIRAEREIEAQDITAGISVTGRASAPQAQVWTDPPSDDSQALSYLALGRPLSNLTSAEGRQLDAASAALSAGGSLIAGQLASRLGLDNAGVSESRALGGSVFGFGKQISPRLYVGFGVSLLGTGQVVTLKYLLRRGFDIEIESSSVETRGSINYRRESD